MLELRILSGYHRGATLPLEARPLSIGADEESDVVLADPGLAARHARLAPEDGRWVLEALDGALRGEHDNACLPKIVLDAGDCARLGAIWLAVCQADSPWQDPPPEPVDAPQAPGMEGAEETQEAEDADQPGAASWLQDERSRFDDSAPPPPMQTAAAAGTRRSRVFLLPLTAMAVLSAAAYAWTAHPDAHPPAARLPAPDLAAAQLDAGQARKLPAAQLESALRKRLGEIDLLSRVTLEVGAREWIIRGALNQEESERLERMARAFAARHVLDFPLRVRIGTPESMLPFRISQVMSGDDPCIITDDGRRLYVGDEYRGVRLAAVAGNQLRFTGKHNLDVLW